MVVGEIVTNLVLIPDSSAVEELVEPIPESEQRSNRRKAEDAFKKYKDILDWIKKIKDVFTLDFWRRLWKKIKGIFKVKDVIDKPKKPKKPVEPELPDKKPKGKKTLLDKIKDKARSVWRAIKNFVVESLQKIKAKGIRKLSESLLGKELLALIDLIKKIVGSKAVKKIGGWIKQLFKIPKGVLKLGGPILILLDVALTIPDAKRKTQETNSRLESSYDRILELTEDTDNVLKQGENGYLQVEDAYGNIVEKFDITLMEWRIFLNTNRMTRMRILFFISYIKVMWEDWVNFLADLIAGVMSLLNQVIDVLKLDEKVLPSGAVGSERMSA